MTSDYVSFYFTIRYDIVGNFQWKNEQKTSLHSFLCNDLDLHRMDFYGSAEWWIYSIANKKNILKDSSIPGVDLSGRDKLYASLILNITEEINSIPYMERQ